MPLSKPIQRVESGCYANNAQIRTALIQHHPAELAAKRILGSFNQPPG